MFIGSIQSKVMNLKLFCYYPLLYTFDLNVLLYKCVLYHKGLNLFNMFTGMNFVHLRSYFKHLETF